MKIVSEAIWQAIHDAQLREPGPWFARLEESLRLSGYWIAPLDATDDMRNVAESAIDEFYDGSKDASVSDCAAYVYVAMRDAWFNPEKPEPPK